MHRVAILLLLLNYRILNKLKSVGEVINALNDLFIEESNRCNKHLTVSMTYFVGFACIFLFIFNIS